MSGDRLNGVAAIVEVAPNGSGIDVVNVIAPLGASRRKKVDRLLETLGPEGRKATDVAYIPHPQGAAAPSPASFPDLSPSADKLGDAKVFVNADQTGRLQRRRRAGR